MSNIMDDDAIRPSVKQIEDALAKQQVIPPDQAAQELDKLIDDAFGITDTGWGLDQIDETVDAIMQLIAAAEQRAELYGRLHETIEHFQAGAISAEYYSAKYEEITSRLAELEQSLRKEQE